MKRVLVVVLILLVCGVVFSQTRGITRNWQFTHSGMVDIGSVCPTHDPACATAWWNFETAVAGTYADDANGYIMTVNGAPTRVDDFSHPRGLGAAEGMGWSFDGIGDYLSRADDGSFDMDLTHNPTGDFSIQCAVTPHAIPASAVIVQKYIFGGNRAYRLLLAGTNVQLVVSNDGATESILASAGAVAVYRPAFITVSYHYVGAANSQGRIYVDNLAMASSNALQGPIWDSTANFVIGANNVGAELFNGLIHDCKVYKGRVITQSEHRTMMTQWQGRMSSQGHTLNQTAASPPALPLNTVASGVEPFIYDIPADTNIIGEITAGSGGLYTPSALTSKWWRGSCETAAGADCSGWTHTDNVGAGAGTVVSDRTTTTSAHGGASIMFTANGGGGPKAGYADGACQTNWIAQDVTEIVRGITTGGTASCSVQLLEYDTNACGTLLATNTVWGPGDPGANWAKLKGTVAAAVWNVATSSWHPRIRCDDNGTAYTVAFDAFMALQAPATFDTDASCATDANADAVCTTTINLDNSSPLTAGNWTVRGTWRQPQDGAETTNKIIFENDPTAGNNNRVRVSHDTDLLRCSVWDQGGVERAATVAAAINADTDSDFEIYHTDTGRVGCCYKDSAAAAWTCGVEAALGIMDGANLNYNFGVDDNVWVRDVMFWRRLLR